MTQTIAPDGLPDDRITCEQCREYQGSHRCRVFRASTMPQLPRRCVKFLPLLSLEDQRTGVQRWPDIQAQIDEIRAIDLAHHQGHT